MLIVSLSTIPPRFDKIGETLKSLLNQSVKADHIYLYIPETYRRFPDWDGQLPHVPDGITIRRTDVDLGPATKVLPAAREHRDLDCDIVFCDDDRLYRSNWLADFVKTRETQPKAAIANLGFLAEEILPCEGKDRPQPSVIRSWRVTDLDFQLRFLGRQIRAGWNWRKVHGPWRRVYKKSGFIDIFEGCGGVMVRADAFPDAAYDIPPVLWTVDDVWLSGMLRLNKVGIWLRGNQFPPKETDARLVEALVTSVVDGSDRQNANLKAAEYFQQNHGIWL